MAHCETGRTLRFAQPWWCLLLAAVTACGAAGPRPVGAEAAATSEPTATDPATAPAPASALEPAPSGSGQRAPSGGGAPPTAALVTAALREIETARRWRDETTAPTPAFLEAVTDDLKRWGRILALLSARGADAEADQVAAAIVALRAYWGPSLLPQDKLTSFPRDTFAVGPLRLLVVQFFEPVPYYPGDETLHKLFQFLVYQEDQPVADYCLEHSNIVEDYYVLGRMDAHGHSQIQPYGDRPPPYATLRARVIEDLRGLSAPTGPSLQQER